MGCVADRIEVSRKRSREVLSIFKFDTSHREIQAIQLDPLLLSCAQRYEIFIEAPMLQVILPRTASRAEPAIPMPGIVLCESSMSSPS